MTNDNPNAEIFAHTAALLRSGSEPTIKATLSNRLNVIIAALDIATLTGTATPKPEGEHSDDLAVDRFAAAMKAKLAKKRAEGRGGWDDPAQCTGENLSLLLRSHVRKGDPLDVGNLAMMIHQRGERII
jgi:hypothetical protein